MNSNRSNVFSVFIFSIILSLGEVECNKGYKELNIVLRRKKCVDGEIYFRKAVQIREKLSNTEDDVDTIERKLWQYFGVLCKLTNNQLTQSVEGESYVHHSMYFFPEGECIGWWPIGNGRRIHVRIRGTSEMTAALRYDQPLSTLLYIPNKVGGSLSSICYV